jgi:hypothetical protein
MTADHPSLYRHTDKYLVVGRTGMRGVCLFATPRGKSIARAVPRSPFLANFRFADDPEGARMKGRIRMPSRHLILLELVLTPRNQEIRSTPVRAPDGQDEHHFPGI